ncbi:MAG: monovalent cation/H(+) antiporter subunit G [Defluviitaleaceae bacterium]|nr:monovalent cation/H(+) antiporter subunit G [Defluviitaleaceae bacterium]
MVFLEIFRFIAAALLIAGGVFILAVATLGLFRLHYVLNRVHAAAKCDTMGTMLILLGVCVLTGYSFATLKIIALIVFLWLTNPVAFFMIGRAEAQTNPRLHSEVDILIVPPKSERSGEEE